jgi:hypothetical protein
MNLIEYTNGTLIAANDWTFFDLSGLGEVESVYFTLNSTDTGDYGMNTASYFCMDKFQVNTTPVPTAINEVENENAVTGVKYVNMAGMTSDKLFDGVNVVVTTHSNGTTTTAKVIK